MNTIVAATERELGMTSRNILTVNVLTSLTLHWLIPRMPHFQAAYPDIDLRLSTLGLNIDFSKDNIDMAITYGHKEDWPHLYCKKLFDDELMMIASNRMIPKNHTLEKLLKKFKAIYVRSHLRKNDWEQWCKAAQIPEPKKADRIYFQNTSQALRAVASGIGLMVTHKPFIMDEIESGALIQISNTVAQPNKAYYLICPKETLGKNKASKFHDWLIQEST